LKIKQEVFKGFLLGILTSVVGVVICTYIIANVKGASFSDTFYMFKNGGRLWMLLALGSIPMLGTFFLLLQKDLEYKARGVVLATLLVSFIAFGFYLL